MSAIKIRFDKNNNPIQPTILLANRSGKKYGNLLYYSLVVTDEFKESSEMTFTVSKYDNGGKNPLWDYVTDFKLVYCLEWDRWFEITVSLDDSTSVTKQVSAQSVGENELSQILLYAEINTEDDIERKEYIADYPTVFYRPIAETKDDENFQTWYTTEQEKMDSTYDIDTAFSDYNKLMKNSSLVNRILDTAPNYSIGTVDETLMNLGAEKEFTFENEYIKDVIDEICDEFGCVAIYENENVDPDITVASAPKRKISFHDLLYTCLDCEYRASYFKTCPKCGSTNISLPYGEETGVFVCKENLTDDISYSVDTEAVKNVYKLKTADEMMDAAVLSCNPNGTMYIYDIADYMKSDMSTELYNKLLEYNADYDKYNNSTTYNIGDVTNYNNYVDTYKEYNSSLENLESIQVGYPALTIAYYDALEVKYYLLTTLLPSSDNETLGETDSETEVAKLTLDSELGNYCPFATTSLGEYSVTTTRNIVETIMRLLVDHRYDVQIIDEGDVRYENYISDEAGIPTSYAGPVWEYDETNKTGTFTCRFKVIRYDQEDDGDNEDSIEPHIGWKYSDGDIVIPFSMDQDDYMNFTEQKVAKILNESEVEDMNLSYILSNEIKVTEELDDFTPKLKFFSSDYLSIIQSVCTNLIDVIDEQLSTAQNSKEYTLELQQMVINLQEYEENYQTKKAIIENAIDEREEQIANVQKLIDIIIGTDNSVGLMGVVHNALNIETYLGEDLYNEFCVYRREELYENENYSVEGYEDDNTWIINKAKEFYQMANIELNNASNMLHNISANLKNLLVLTEFQDIVDNFQVGNWIRVLIDGEVYKLRLISYVINYDDLTTLDVEFSDAEQVASGLLNIQLTLDNQNKQLQDAYAKALKQAEELNAANATINELKSTAITTNNVYSKMSTLQLLLGKNGQDGESAITVQIDSSNGNIFKSNNIVTTLTCRAFYGTTEVTDKITSCTWQKIDQDGNIDKTWNRTMSGNTINLTNADVLNKASFTCTVDIDL